MIHRYGRTFNYESWSDVVHRAAHGHSWLGEREKASRNAIDRLDWRGTPTFESALELANRGWPDGWNKVKEIASKISDSVSSKVTTIETRMEECGDELDVPLLLTGEPECWYNYPLVEHKANGGRIVRMAINIFISSGVSHEAIINRGAAALAVLDALESNGYRVELTVMTAGNGTEQSTPFVCSFVAKESDQPIDIDRLAFTVVHPSSVRRIIFGLWETLPENIGRDYGIRQGLYYAIPCTSPNANEYDVYLDMLHYDDNWQSLECATSKALDALQASGLLTLRSEVAA